MVLKNLFSTEMLGESRRIIRQGIVVSIVVWLSIAIVAWVEPRIITALNRTLSGALVGFSASLISYYVLSLPNDRNSRGYYRNMLSILVTAYALFVFCLYLLLTQGILLIVPSLTLEQSLVAIFFASFLLGCYMSIGSILDQYTLTNRRYIWLGILGSICIYALIAGFLIRGFSQDIWFLVSLGVVRVITSLALSWFISRGSSLSALNVRFIVLNLLVLPITILLSK
jgi:hypothetical protein